MPAPRSPGQPKPKVRALRRALAAKVDQQAEWEQPELFHIAPDLDLLRKARTASARDWTYLTDTIVFDHAEKFGWSKRQTNHVRRTLKMIQLIRPGSSVQVRASQVLQLSGYDSTANQVSHPSFSESIPKR